MNDARINRLNERFGVAGRLHFCQGRGDLIKAELTYQTALIELYLQGAHITRFNTKKNSPTGENKDMLWMSEAATYQAETGLRGGIPLCWPWFGPHLRDTGKPKHGYARTSNFLVKETRADNNATSIILTLDAAIAPYSEWRNKASLEVEIKLTDSLWMEMRTKNISDHPLTIGNALHNYFSTPCHSSAALPSVTGLTYLDNTQNYQRCTQDDALNIFGEIDRIYLNPPKNLRLINSSDPLATAMTSWGNANVVVWNPGQVIAKGMPDFNDQGYRTMLCIEPANTLEHSIKLKPGELHCLGQCIYPATTPSLNATSLLETV